MKYITEYRQIDAIKALSNKIGDVASGHRLTFMEVCGTHTMAIARFGIKELLPPDIRLLSGPGCPVCVTPNRYIDHAIALSRLEDTTITTFGDMVRVPGSSSSLERERADGSDINIVYSPLDALDSAGLNSSKEVIFLSVGFETTIPTVASTLIMAKKRGIDNFSILSANKVVPPALEALLGGDLNLDGFILPVHVSTIIGGKVYEPVVNKYRIPSSIAGFEPTDILESILELTEQNLSDNPHLSIQYRRAVSIEGNIKAQQLINEVFEPTDAEWRGIGTIPLSGLKLRDLFKKFDASTKFGVDIEETRVETGCICGKILQGLCDPKDCPLFGNRCRPESPVGACMVSSEGTCAAWYRYNV